MEDLKATQRTKLKSAVRQVLASAALSDADNPAANQTMLNALRHLSEQMRALPGVADSDTDDLTGEVQDALRAAQDLSPAELAQFLRGLGDLAEGTAPQGGSLEDLAGWLEAQFGPILSRRVGLESGADQTQQIKDAIKAQIGASLADKGFATTAPPAQPAPGAMTRHHLFWQNFAALAPGLAPLLVQPGGADAAGTQISSILASLDLPSGVRVAGSPGAATLDFSATDDAVQAEMLVQIIADAPDIPGWTVSVGGHVP